MPVTVTMHANLDAPTRESLVGELESQQTLEDALRWGLSQRPPARVADVVVQDEFTHDIVLAHSSGNFLVYDTT